MDFVFYIVAGLVGLFLLALVAFPNVLMPAAKPLTKRVGASYWGYYEGLSESAADAPPEETIEVKANPRKHKVVAGSSMYAAGRGITMRG